MQQLSLMFSAASDGAVCSGNGTRVERAVWAPLGVAALDWGTSTAASVATSVVNGTAAA
jgi:hypothetical protein